MAGALDATWLAGIAIARAKGWTITADFMSRAYLGDGSAVTYYNDSSVINTIRASGVYQQKISSWVSQYKNTGTRTFSDVVEFEGGTDLYMDFQHITIKGYVEDTGNMYVEMHVIYDFDSIRTNINNLSIPNAANDFGYMLQALGILKPFHIYVKGYEWAGKRVIPYPGSYIQIGSTGDNVRLVQQRLNELGFSAGTVDGVFGTRTRSAVISFQSSRGLSADGVVGPATWNVLFN